MSEAAKAAVQAAISEYWRKATGLPPPSERGWPGQPKEPGDYVERTIRERHAERKAHKAPEERAWPPVESPPGRRDPSWRNNNNPGSDNGVRALEDAYEGLDLLG